jgi:hypothetical protein
LTKARLHLFGIGKHCKDGIGYSYGNTYEESGPSTSSEELSPPHLYSTFVSESVQSKVMKIAEQSESKMASKDRYDSRIAHKTQNENKADKTNLSGSISIWVPKDKIVYLSGY